MRTIILFALLTTSIFSIAQDNYEQMHKKEMKQQKYFDQYRDSKRSVGFGNSDEDDESDFKKPLILRVELVRNEYSSESYVDSIALAKAMESRYLAMLGKNDGIIVILKLQGYKKREKRRTFILTAPYKTTSYIRNKRKEFA
jgi:hypothetical protein